MISITKREASRRIQTVPYAASNRDISQMQNHIMRCMQPWLQQAFVALVIAIVALEMPDATKAYDETERTIVTPKPTLTPTPTPTLTPTPTPMAKTTTTNTTTTTTTTTMLATWLNIIDEAIRPIALITAINEAKTTDKTTSHGEGSKNIVHSSSDIDSVTPGIMATISNSFEHPEDMKLNLSSTTLATETITMEKTIAQGDTTPRTTTRIAMFFTTPVNDNASDDQNHMQELNMSFHEYCLANRDSFADLLTIVLYSIVCFVGLFGNTLVIYVVLRFSKMQTVTNIYILNLAIADECFLIGIPFLLYTMRICSWTFGEYMCKAYMVSTSITQFTSSIFLLIMSADRFIAVCHPIASPRYRTIRIAKLVSAVAWLTSVVLMLPVILFASTITQEDGLHHSCNIEWPEAYNKHTGTTFILYTFFLGFATPLCFILCFYYLVIKKLHAVGRKHKSKEKKRSHRKVTRLVLTVITVYVLCWLPQWISQVALINSNPDQNDLSRLEVLIFLLLGCLAYSNSAMNPILYAFLSDNFRKSFSKAFTCMARHEVNAQLQVEPSVFTKHGGSRRRGSKRLIAQATTKAKAKTALLPTTAGNNNSSTTTSSTTTQAEKHIVAIAMNATTAQTTTTTTTMTTSTCNTVTQLNENSTKNGLINAEDIVLLLDKQHSICTTLVKHDGTNHLSGSSTLQTDF